MKENLKNHEQKLKQKREDKIFFMKVVLKIGLFGFHKYTLVAISWQTMRVSGRDRY